MDHFMEAYLRWLGQASDEELVRRKDEVAVALLQAGIESVLSGLLLDLLGEEIDARDQVLQLRQKHRQLDEEDDAFDLQPSPALFTGLL
jgi:hypothetical protein